MFRKLQHIYTGLLCENTNPDWRLPIFQEFFDAIVSTLGDKVKGVTDFDEFCEIFQQNALDFTHGHHDTNTIKTIYGTSWYDLTIRDAEWQFVFKIMEHRKPGFMDGGRMFHNMRTVLHSFIDYKISLMKPCFERWKILQAKSEESGLDLTFESETAPEPIPYSNGVCVAYKLPDGTIHREDGPAVIWSDGVEEWYQNGKRHRLDGPAVKYLTTGKESYYINGEYYTKEGFKERLQQLKIKDLLNQRSKDAGLDLTFE